MESKPLKAMGLRCGVRIVQTIGFHKKEVIPLGHSGLGNMIIAWIQCIFIYLDRCIIENIVEHWGKTLLHKSYFEFYASHGHVSASVAVCKHGQTHQVYLNHLLKTKNFYISRVKHAWPWYPSEDITSKQTPFIHLDSSGYPYPINKLRELTS